MTSNLEIFLESYVDEKEPEIIEEKERKPAGYWLDLKNIEDELNETIKYFGHFPSYKELRDHNCGLLTGIESYHGGYNKVRTKKGYLPSKKEKGYWQN